MMRVAWIVAGAFALALGVYLQQQTPAAPSAARPDWALPDQTGTLRQAAEFDGRWQLVNFWASWCPPCIEEIPLLIDAQSRYPELVLLGPALDRIEAAQAAAERLGITYPVLFGDLGVSDWMTALGDTRGALPFSVLIDPDGIIRERHWGALTEEQLDEWLRPLAG